MGHEIKPDDAARGEASNRNSVVAYGGAHDKISIQIVDHILRVDISGEPDGDSLTDCFREALARGMLGMNMPTLVNLTGFVGGIDWTGLRAIAELAPWGSADTRPSRVAYVTDSVWFAALLKLITLLFPKSTHRQFADVESGLNWLRSAG